MENDDYDAPINKLRRTILRLMLCDCGKARLLGPCPSCLSSTKAIGRDANDQPPDIPCYRCGTPNTRRIPHAWKPTRQRDDCVWIVSVMHCCGAATSTEPVAIVSDYLQDAPAIAKRICDTMNHSLGTSAPGPAIDVSVKARSRRTVEAAQRVLS